MYYKVIKENQVIDAVNSLRYVRQNPRNGMVLSCKKESGQGVLSYDGSTIYQLAGKNSLNGNYDVVDLVKINETEFQRLRDLFDGVESEPADDGFQETFEPLKEPMSIAKMREKIVQLDEQVSKMMALLDV